MSTELFPAEIASRIENCGVIAVVTIDDAGSAKDLAAALLAGGIDAIELTLRTPAAITAMRTLRENVPELLVGAGTVLTQDQVQGVVEAGAQFAVSPGLNAKVVEAALAANLPFAPGIMTPSELEAGLELGLRTFKFFPAEPSGGLRYLKSMAAPYKHLGVRFVPLGGLNESNLAGYLENPLVSAVGGSWLAPADLIRERQWSEIERRAVVARGIADRVREGQSR